MNLKFKFLEYLEYEKRRSMHTIISYENTIRSYDTFLKSEGCTIQEALRPHVRAFIVDLSEKKYAPKSINQKIKCLRSFYKYCRRNEYVKKDPMYGISLLKESKHMPAYFVKSETITDVLDNISTRSRKMKTKVTRDRLILETLYCTGVRVDELVNIQFDDINFRKGTLKVLGKGNKERLVFLLPALLQLVREYSVLIKRSAGYLFEAPKAKGPLNKMYVWRAVRKYFPACEFGISASAHSFRHSMATHLLESGAPIQGVQKALGHTSLLATQLYTHYDKDRIKKVFDLASPKA